MKKIFAFAFIFLLIVSLYTFVPVSADERITEVNGTTWVFNNPVSPTQYTYEWNVTFTSNSYDCSQVKVVPSGNNILRYYRPNTSSYLTVTNSTGYFSNSVYRTVTFTGNVTSGQSMSSLIDYLYANAVLQTPSTSYTVSQGAVSHGTISFSSSTVASGGSVTVTATPDSGYTYPAASGITVSGTHGVVTGSNGTYTIPNIESNITVSVTFPSSTPSTWVVSRGEVWNGSIVLNNASTGASNLTSVNVSNGGDIWISLNPDSGYVLPSGISVHGTYGGVQQVSGSNGYQYNISNIQSDCTVDVNFPSASPSNATITYQFENCTTSAPTSVSSGSDVSGTIVPNAGFTLPLSLTAQSAGLPVRSDYNPSTGAFTLYNCQGDVFAYATAIQEDASNTVTYDLTHCTCSMSITSYNNGATITFTLAPDIGYLMSDEDTKVSFDGFFISNYAPPDSYNFSYNEVFATGDLVIVGVAKPWYDLVGSGSGYNNYPGSYQDGYDTGFNDGQNSVSSDSSVLSGRDRYNAIYHVAYSAGLNSVSIDSDDEHGRVLANQIYNSGKQVGILSVNAYAEDGSDSQSVYASIYNAGLNSVSNSSPSSSPGYILYRSIYDDGFVSGQNSVTSDGVSQAVTGFIPSIIASIGGGLLYVGDHISIFGITVASFFALVILLAAGLWLFKIFKGSL